MDHTTTFARDSLQNHFHLDALYCAHLNSLLPSIEAGREDVTRTSGQRIKQLNDYASGEMPISALWPKGRQILPKIRFVVDELVTVAESGGLN